MGITIGMARRIPLEQPPSRSAEARVKQQQAAFRTRIGKKLREARLNAGLSQVQLGVRANVSANYIGQAELGRRGVTIDFLVRVGLHLSVEVGYFLSE
jgi:ribosome-binding protein aMBF1 (putative translation factor)